MGFFNGFKSRNEKNNDKREDLFTCTYKGNEYLITYKYNQKTNKLEEIEAKITKFSDNQSRKPTDTVRLIIDKESGINNNSKQKLMECRVAHYDSEWEVNVNNLDHMYENRNILVELDLKALVNDPTYTMMLLDELLSEQNINNVLSEGLKENPQIECGIYVGGLKEGEREGTWRLDYDRKIGQMSHNSPALKRERFKNRQMVAGNDYNHLVKLESEISLQMQEYNQKVNEIIQENGSVDKLKEKIALNKSKIVQTRDNTKKSNYLNLEDMDIDTEKMILDGKEYNIEFKYDLKSNELKEIEVTLLSNQNLEDTKKQKIGDTIKLEIDQKSNIISNSGQDLMECRISYYNIENAIYLENKNSRDILVELDLQAMNYDKEYIVNLAERLLEKERVDRYLKNGMKENPEKQCGNYIGGLHKTKENVWKKFYNEDIAKIIHNSPEMKQKRLEAKIKDDEKNVSEIAMLEKRIKDLQEKYQSIINKYGSKKTLVEIMNIQNDRNMINAPEISRNSENNNNSQITNSQIDRNMVKPPKMSRGLKDNDTPEI